MWGPAQRRDTQHPLGQNGGKWNRPLHDPPKRKWRPRHSGIFSPGPLLGLGPRQLTALVKKTLVGIHPNPGPSERSERRRERRNERRRERRVEERSVRRMEGVIVTWNVQRMSLRENNRARLRRVCDRIIREGWEIVLLTELGAEENGVVWLGEEGEECVIVHARKAGVLLRGRALQMWVEEGQQKWYSERVATVVFGGMRLVSVYQPIWGMNEEAMGEYRAEVERQLEMNGNECVVIGGDFNASVGRSESREGICGRFGIGRVNDAGRDLIEWCEVNGMAYVNSYMRHARRGTWFHMRWARWYELDGFLVRKDERARVVRKMWTMDDGGLSDHRPKCMKVEVRRERWRRVIRNESVRRAPRVRWEVLKDEEKKIEYERKTSELWEREHERDAENRGEDWKQVSRVMMNAAVDVCGVVRKEVVSPWVIGHEEELERMRVNVRDVTRSRNEWLRDTRMRRRLRPRGGERLNEEHERIREEVKRARKNLKKRLKELEKEWWNERIRECELACVQGRVGDMYKCLRKIGMRGRPAAKGTTVNANEFKEHFERVSKDRYEEEPSMIVETVNRAKDLRMDVRAQEANEFMNEVPEREEIEEAMKEMKESAPGEEGVRIGYIRFACEEMKARIIRIVQEMFEHDAGRWDDSLKVGIMIPLFKKGDRNDKNNYRGVCLLSMGSRILGRVMAKRLGWWAEHLGLLDENQAGFRKGRSTADVVQMMVRMNEDVGDCKKRVREYEDERRMNDEEWPSARLLDLRKAYPRVNKPALWMLLERYGLNGRCLETVKGMHECTEYKVRGNEGMSEAWRPERGLREGCSTSPVLFNVFHQAVMRQAESARENGRENVGVEWRWIPGGSFAGEASWEKGCTEAKSVIITSALFADDTTIVGVKGEMEEGVRIVKRVMSKWEERNNEDKEEILDFATEEGEDIRVLGNWMGAKTDGNKRIRRAGGLWARVKGWMKGSKMSKRWQARVVEACVESSLLYDCQARVWYKRDIKRLQKWMDKCYRYVWSNRNGQPLRQMSERHVNMTDVRERLGVKSVEWKIEKRVLERIGHVMRMENDRITKVMVLGWWKELEGRSKMKGRKKKTVLFWKRTLKEGGIDWTEVEKLSAERKVWKDLVIERMNHLHKWERQKGHEYEWSENEERMTRNVRGRLTMVCRYEGCGKVCKSRAGLTMHEKRMHRVAVERVRFECVKCGEQMKTEGAKKNHEKTCLGGAGGTDGRRECGRCARWVTRTNYARHVRVCGGERREEVAERRGVRGKVKECERCRRVLSAANMARHREGCRVWDPGGEPSP